MGLVDELLAGDWAVDELPERDGWTFEADDCMVPAWDAPGSGGGAPSSSSSSSAAAGSDASPWWALAADEENVAVAALAHRELKVEPQDADADALLVEKALAPSAAISPVPKQQQQAREPAAKGAFSLLLSEDSQPDSGSESARTGTTDTSSNGSVKASPLSEQAEQDARPAAKGKAVAKKPRRRAGSAGATAKSPSKAPAELAWDERNLTPLEIRRKRNRESMQRARRRQRDDIEQMKETLMQLEQQYQSLSDASVKRRKQGEAAVAPPKLEANYYELADLSHVLKEEKFLLERMLTDKQKTYRRFQQVMVDRRDELELPCPTTTSDTSLFSDFEFAPMTEHQINEHIRNCYQHIRHVEETAKPFTSRQFAEIEDTVGGKPARRYSTGSPMSMMGGAEFEPGCPIPPSATFGWKVMCESTPSGDFLVSFSKFFRGVTAQEAMINSWQRTQDPKKHSSPFRRHVRHEVLQVINDSAYITGVDIEHPVLPDKFMRAHNLNFRMQTERGFVIGRYSVNPMSSEVRAALERDSPFEYVDSCNWVEFATQHDEETGEEGVNVKFIASTEYNTQEDMYVRLVNSISRTMIWEYAVMPCPLTLLPS